MDISVRPTKQDWKYAILGTGALGGLYGGLLAEAGFDVHFLVRSDYNHVRKHGLQVDSPLGDFHLSSPNVYASPSDMPKVDVAIVAWKTTANGALAETLHQVCAPDTMVLVLQNGLDIERDAAQVVGDDHVLGGCCFLCSNKIGPGHIQHLDYGRISFGEYSTELSGSITERMKVLTEHFQSAKIDMRPAEDLRAVRWQKLVWNIPFNGLPVVLGGDSQQILSDPKTSDLAESLMHEVRDAAIANGCDIPMSHIDKMLSDTRKMVPYGSSMSLDFRAHRPMEVESIFGATLRAAQNAGCSVPKIEMLYQQLCFLDRVNRHSP